MYSTYMYMYRSHSTCMYMYLGVVVIFCMFGNWNCFYVAVLGTFLYLFLFSPSFPLFLVISCSSFLGRVGGEQVIYLGTGCYRKGIVIHEIFHALGRWHEHSRPDRDLSVTVHLDNVRPGMYSYVA